MSVTEIPLDTVCMLCVCVFAVRVLKLDWLIVVKDESDFRVRSLLCCTFSWPLGDLGLLP